MDDYDFNFDQRSVDSSERTDSDGGGMSFVFYDGRRQKKKKTEDGDDGKETSQVDFGDAVEVELSSAALGEPAPPESAAATALENQPDSADNTSPRIGHKINITV